MVSFWIWLVGLIFFFIELIRLIWPSIWTWPISNFEQRRSNKSSAKICHSFIESSYYFEHWCIIHLTLFVPAWAIMVLCVVCSLSYSTFLFIFKGGSIPQDFVSRRSLWPIPNLFYWTSFGKQSIMESWLGPMSN